MRHFAILFLSAVLCWGVVQRVSAIDIQFDYSYDSPTPFFDAAQTRLALEAAGNFYENLINDHLDPLVANGVNSWSLSIAHPGTGETTTVQDLFVQADTLTILVGGRDLPGDALAESGQWSGAVEGRQDWVFRVLQRGQDFGRGVGSTDFGPWGDVLSFDTTNADGTPRNWHFGLLSEPGADQWDFVSVALHQLGHALGLGRADSWRTLVDDEAARFTGPASQAEFGGPIDLEPSDVTPFLHFKDGTTSTLVGNGDSAVAVNTPKLAPGERRMLTELDLAALSDIGWQVTGFERELQAGDADRNFSIDQIDIAQILAAGKYLTGEPATWGEGDWNGAPGGSPGQPPSGDGVFDRRDILASLQVDLYLTGPYNRTDSTRPSTPLQPGDTNQDLSFNQSDIAQVLAAGKYLSGERATWGEGDWDGAPGGSPGDPPRGDGRFDQQDIVAAQQSGVYLTGSYSARLDESIARSPDDHLFRATFGSTSDSVALGNVAPPGLDPPSLVNRVLNGTGPLKSRDTVADVRLIYVPEPSGLVLMFPGLLWGLWAVWRGASIRSARGRGQASKRC